MQFSFNVPDEFSGVLPLSPREFAAEVRLAAAIHWYSQGKVSQEMAAEFVEMDRTDFLHAVSARNVDVFPVDFDELNEEMERGLSAYRKRLAPDLPEPGGLV